ncbi:MAG: thioredoxin domain-containing protein [Sediminibacterium sp.]|nr:thioredoxin domain-containing protein [Sediminibacterium sp.]
MQQYPYAIALLEQLYAHKINFSKADLRQQLQYFNTDVQKTTLFKLLNRFLLLDTSTFDRAYPELIELENAKGLSQRIGDPNATMNMVVFWAWWCGPCRQEIPELKRLYQKYRGSGLAVTSISIDISSIPKLYLFDAQHRLLGKFSGFGDENTAQLNALLKTLQPIHSKE